MISAEQPNSLPHGVEESSSDGLTQACSPGGLQGPTDRAEVPKASSGLRTGPSSFPFHSLGQSKSPDQIRRAAK